MLLRKFSWLYRCANWRYREFFAAENIKDIKSFRAKKIGFNISGNYSGWFLIANCAGKKCTARCSLRVAQRFSDVCTLWSSYHWANISAEPHALEQRAVHCLLDEFQWEQTPYSHLAKQGAVLSRYSEMLNPIFFARKNLISFIFSAAKNSLHRQFAHR